jgi:Protein of unknown function (DUF1416)
MIILLAMLVACGGSDKAWETADTGRMPESPMQRDLRMDVSPSAGSGLLPQTRIYPPSAFESLLSFQLAPTVTLEGSLSGAYTRPWSADAPSEVAPLDAVMTLAMEQSLSYGVALTKAEEEGVFRISVPQGNNYTLAVVPARAESAPVLVESLNLLEDSELNLELPVGYPIYGLVTDGAGRPLADAPLSLRAVGTPVPVTSATFTTDSRGWYLARVASYGEWELVTASGSVEGRSYVIPEVSAVALVESEQGAQLNLAVGDIAATGVIGKVVDADGQAVSDAKVRIRSRSLVGSDGRFDTEVNTSSDGTFFLEALAGSYSLEVVAPYERLDSPILQDLTLEPGVIDLGRLQMAAPALLEGQVVGDGPEAGVQVTATQVGLQGFSYSGTTDDNGRYAIPVPAGSYSLLINPATPDQWASMRRQQTTEDRPLTQLVEGSLLTGQVLFGEVGQAYSLVELKATPGGGLLARTVTDDNGNFQFRVLLPETGEGDSGDTGSDSGDSGSDSGADSGTDSGSDSGA